MGTRSKGIAWVALACSALAAGCGGSGDGDAGSGAGVGGGGLVSGATGAGGTLFPTSGNGSAGSGGNDGCNSVVKGTIRDFHDTHPDFEAELGDDKGIVEPELGSDGKPVYAGDPTTP